MTAGPRAGRTNQNGISVCLSATDYTGVYVVDGLAPSTTYQVRFTVDGQAEPGRPYEVTTAPPVGAPGRWSFAFGSCARFETQPIFPTIQVLAPELFLFVGDNHYGNTPARLEGVLLLSGDLHRSMLRLIPRAGAGGYDATLPDPTLGVTIRGLDGAPRRTWEIKRSSLALP